MKKREDESPATIMPFFIALLHYPMLNKRGAAVATSVTNFDIHDIARAGKTYGVDGYFIVTPIRMQRDFIHRIIRHWVEEEGAVYNPTRGDALRDVEVAADLTAVGASIARNGKGEPLWVATSARAGAPAIALEKLREKLASGEQNVCLLFGTGHGIHPDLLELVDAVLEPIPGPSDYNHLSVRSAVAIYLDRLLGNG